MYFFSNSPVRWRLTNVVWSGVNVRNQRLWQQRWAARRDGRRGEVGASEESAVADGDEIAFPEGFGCCCLVELTCLASTAIADQHQLEGGNLNLSHGYVCLGRVESYGQIARHCEYARAPKVSVCGKPNER